MALDESRQVVDQNFPQPAEELALRLASELGKVSVRLQVRFLDDVGWAHASPQLGVDLGSREQVQVIVVQLKQLPERLLRSTPSRVDQPLGRRQLRGGLLRMRRNQVLTLSADGSRGPHLLYLAAEFRAGCHGVAADFPEKDAESQRRALFSSTSFAPEATFFTMGRLSTRQRGR